MPVFTGYNFSIYFMGNYNILPISFRIICTCIVNSSIGNSFYWGTDRYCNINSIMDVCTSLFSILSNNWPIARLYPSLWLRQRWGFRCRIQLWCFRCWLRCRSLRILIFRWDSISIRIFFFCSFKISVWTCIFHNFNSTFAIRVRTFGNFFIKIKFFAI